MGPMSTLPFSQACENNQAPILAVLQQAFADRRQVLEVGSGTGQHGVYFAPRLPHLVWQTSDLAENHPGIRAWQAAHPAPNLRAPLLFDLRGSTWPDGPFDAVFSANTAHIMGWPEVEALFSGLPAFLRDDATLAIYGPFNTRGEFTSQSNREFDGWLKARDPRSGIRDFEAVDALAGNIGFELIEDVAMPANNRMLVWRRGAT